MTETSKPPQKRKKGRPKTTPSTDHITAEETTAGKKGKTTHGPGTVIKETKETPLETTTRTVPAANNATDLQQHQQTTPSSSSFSNNASTHNTPSVLEQSHQLIPVSQGKALVPVPIVEHPPPLQAGNYTTPAIIKRATNFGMNVVFNIVPFILMAKQLETGGIFFQRCIADLRHARYLGNVESTAVNVWEEYGRAAVEAGVRQARNNRSNSMVKCLLGA